MTSRASRCKARRQSPSLVAWNKCEQVQTDLFDRVKLHGLGGTFVYTIYVRLMWKVQHRGFPCLEGRDVKVGTAKTV